MARVDARRLAARAAGRGLDLRFALASGSGSATIAVSGLEAGDGLAAVLDLTSGTDHVDTATIVAAGSLSPGGDLSSNKALVAYYRF